MRSLFKASKKAESLLLGILLAIVGGYLDIYCYLARGKVFANTQTGNLVLLGLNIAQGNLSKVIHYLISITAFIIGVALGKVIEVKYQEKKYFSWLHIILSSEIIVVCIVMFIPEGKFNIVANMLISFMCALQVHGFRKVEGKAYSTIMFTGNLKNLSDHLTGYFLTKDKEALNGAMVYLCIIIAFVIGGWLGALTVEEFKTKAVGLINIVLIIVFVSLYLERRNLNV